MQDLVYRDSVVYSTSGRIIRINIYTYMMKLACKDIKPDVDCAFEATGETATDAAKMMLAHARADHAEDVKDGSDEDLIKMFESKAHE